MHYQVVVLIQVSYLEALFCTCQYVAINVQYLRLSTAGTAFPCRRIKSVFPRKNSCAVYPRMVVPRAVCRFQQIASRPSVISRYALHLAYKILYSVHCIRAWIIQSRCSYSDCLPSDCRRGIGASGMSSLDSQIPTFRDNLVPSLPRSEMSRGRSGTECSV